MAGTQQNNPNANPPLSSSAPPTAQLAAATLLSAGDIDLQNYTATPDHLPALNDDGICNTKLTQVGPNPSKAKDKFLIRSNYVKIKTLPKELWAYSLKFWRRHPQDGSKMIEFNKKREISGAFDALLRSGVVSLNQQPKNWATNFKELWTSA